MSPFYWVFGSSLLGLGLIGCVFSAVAWKRAHGSTGEVRKQVVARREREFGDWVESSQPHTQL